MPISVRFVEFPTFSNPKITHNASYFFKMLQTDRCQSNYKVKHFFSMPGVSEPQILGKSIEQNEIK